jgi:hypothetical protein
MFRIIGDNSTYQLNDANQIAPLGAKFSGSWLLVGGVRYSNFGHITEHYTSEQLKKGNLQFFYKNGKPRIFIVDIDHGTTRVWGKGAKICYWR